MKVLVASTFFLLLLANAWTLHFYWNDGKFKEEKSPLTGRPCTSIDKITTVTLCPGTFDSFFGGFLLPLLELLAPSAKSNPCNPVSFYCLVLAPPHAVSFHASWILKCTTTKRAQKWTHIHPIDVLWTLSPPR
ncbi:hypothetical protein K469DRAFT_778854 [Zopfia rhizophila CBS 207.26]|uniref:Uncharacterized protein n=1 Tax=Zopfia rhizophila CBS 207.26 TaxID=1314779 RepID=A0A6A6D573_9PEZI|nr:hypothetical protein K469DRAFT_778854 [Zopfia rhizophila CBS 207.26]